jgi:D-alanyl-D-alanine carboxypeptidase
LQLAERGALSLDRSAAHYLPDFPYSGDITIRQLLAHSAGIPNPIPLRWIHLREEHASFDDAEFFRSVFARHRRTKTDPNTRFAYSNLGYVLLGRVIEQVSDHSYEQYVTGNILEPLGSSPGTLGFVLPDTLQALLKPETTLLSGESRKMLFDENILNDGRPSGMTLSWFRGEVDGHVYLAHAGGGGGYYAELRIYPGLQRGSVIFFNRSGMSNERFLDQVDPYLMGQST